MKTWALMCWLLAATCAQARDEQLLASSAAQLVRQSRPEPAAITPAARGTKVTLAIARAHKKGWIEEGIEATRAELLDCQRETSVVLTTSAMRSESQQSHCYRF